MSWSEIRLNPVYIMILFLVIGPFLMIWGGVNYMINNRVEDDCTSVTNGVVISVEMNKRMWHKQWQITYVATVKPNDDAIFEEATIKSAKTNYAYEEGERVKIHYDPSDTSTYYIEHAAPTRGYITVVISGVVLLVIGLFIRGFIKIMKS